MNLITAMVVSYMIKTYNSTFPQILKFIWYNAEIAITGAKRKSSKEKLYNELSLQPLKKQVWHRNQCYFFKIFKYHCRKYLLSIIPTSVSTCNTRNTNNIPLFKVKRNFFQKNFLFNGTNWTKIFATQEARISSRNHF